MQILSRGVKALTGLMLIIICTMIPAGLVLPQNDLSFSLIQLKSTFQVHGLLFSSLLFGPEIGTICATSYLIIGLFYLPVFHGGGSVGYLLTPEFGYLLGFIPAAWICGKLSKNNPNANLIHYSIYTIFSLLILHITGISYLILGKLLLGINDLFNLILINTIIPLPSQLLLSIAITPLSLITKRVLMLK